MWNCCCEYKDPGIEDDCCPDWCESRRVKGRFGLAFVAETPCCCPEPIGWQVEFCDTPSKVEQRCREMVQWANCPPLPRCEPCPPVEVCSPCFPPRCNPCCPISNPCPPRCPPRCCPCPCPPRKKCRPKVECPCCSSSKNKQKCCCSSKLKPRCRCDMYDEDDDDEPCPCSGKKGDERRSRNRRDDRKKDRDSDRGDRDINSNGSFYDDELPVKESKSKAKTIESQSFVSNTPAPYRPSNQRTVTPPRTGRNTPVQSKMNIQNLSTSSQENNSRPDSPLNIKSSNVSETEKKPNNEPTTFSNEEYTIDYTQSAQKTQIKSSTMSNYQTVAYTHYQPIHHLEPTYTRNIKEIENNDVNLYNINTKTYYDSSNNSELIKSLPNSVRNISREPFRQSKNEMFCNKKSSSQIKCCDLVKSSIKQSKFEPKQLNKFTAVYSNVESLETEDLLLVKRRRWLPLEFIRSIKKKVVGLFKSNYSDNEDDTDSNYSDIAYGDTYNELLFSNKNIKKIE